jgi:hypothetical protein
VAASIATAIAAGCGGGGEGATGSETHPFEVYAATTVTANKLTQAQFLARANQICRHGWHEILGNFAEYSSWQSPKLSKQEVFIKSVRLSFLAGFDFHVFDDLRDLGAPKGQERQVEKVLGTMQEGVERGQRQVRVTSVPQLQALFADYNQLARRYGLRDCLVDGTRLVKVQA